MRNIYKTEERKHLILHVYDRDLEVDVPINEEQRYIMAAENVSKKIEAYADTYVRRQYIHQRCYTDILLMAMLDFAVMSKERD